MKKNKLLKNFVKISPNLKEFIVDNELWKFCPACQEEDCDKDNPYTWKVCWDAPQRMFRLSNYIIENIEDNEYIFVSSGGDEYDFFFGDKKQIEEKINQFIKKGLLCSNTGYASAWAKGRRWQVKGFFMIYNFIKDRQVTNSQGGYSPWPA